MSLELEVRENVRTRRGGPTSVSRTDDDRMGVQEPIRTRHPSCVVEISAGRAKAIWSFDHDLKESWGWMQRRSSLIPIDVQTPEAYLRGNPGTREIYTIERCRCHWAMEAILDVALFILLRSGCPRREARLRHFHTSYRQFQTTSKWPYSPPTGSK